MAEFPLWCSGLRTWHCHSCDVIVPVTQIQSQALGIFICHGCSQKKKKKKERERKRERNGRLNMAHGPKFAKSCPKGNAWHLNVTWSGIYPGLSMRQTGLVHPWILYFIHSGAFTRGLSQTCSVRIGGVIWTWLHRTVMWAIAIQTQRRLSGWAQS